MYLNCHSYYSLRYGTLSPKALVDIAQSLGIRRLVLTDINNTSGIFEFYQACKKANIQPVIGIEFRQNNEFRYIGIAQNIAGFTELTTLLTQHLTQNSDIPRIAPAWKNAAVIYRSLPKPITEFSTNEWFGIRPHEAGKLYSSSLGRHLDKLVALSTVTFQEKEGYRVHKLLRCIDENIIIGRLKDYPHAHESAYFHHPENLRKSYAMYPRILDNTDHLLDQCHIEITTGSQVNRHFFTESREEDFKLLTKLAIEGCRRRYGNHKAAQERIQKELSVIDTLGFATYFLITWDIVRYAQNMGYYHVGRGSGANSIVAYCIRITDVDPLELDLYFERFINPHRSSPPDFDIDFSWDQRDDITDYIIKRYGREKTALLATYNTFKRKSVIRELGKVFGLPKADIDEMVRYPQAKHHHAYAKHILHYGKKIEGLPNYLGIHAGGILISEQSLYHHTALQMMPKGFPIVQFDMYAAEDMGFHKYDVLSQRGLGHIKDAVDLIHQNRNEMVDVHQITKIKNDVKVKNQLRAGKCIGCFYIESPAMRGLLTKLKCDNYVHLVAASSIIRPGVAQSGMMREYIMRFHRPKNIQYLHPIFEKHLGETFGVMVYQEDVMKIVHHFAGLGLDESDVLRRIMTGKKKSSDTFYQLRDKFFNNCKERGYPDSLTNEVWRQVESFSGYSFCKAHSASFAVESFQSLYLKTYYPLEFMVAVINNFGGFYNTELYVHEARMQGGHIHPPCINHSRHLTHIYGKDIYLGFIHIRELESRVIEDILAERSKNGPFKSFANFLERLFIPKIQLDILIRIGAFQFTGMSKYELMWEKNGYNAQSADSTYCPKLFQPQSESFTLPAFEAIPHEQAFDEIELLGFPLCSPFDLLAEKISSTATAAQLHRLEGRQVQIVGYYVCKKNVITVNKKYMCFGTWIDEKGDFFDTIHFPPAYAAYPLQGKGLYLLIGKVSLDFGFPSIEISSLKKLPYISDERY